MYWEKTKTIINDPDFLEEFNNFQSFVAKQLGLFQNSEPEAEEVVKSEEDETDELKAMEVVNVD